MEKLRTKLLREYFLLTYKRFHIFTGHKKYEESLILSVINNGGSICFSFTNLSTNEILIFDNPSSGEYVVPLQKGRENRISD